ncbi:GGDEF domain-containing protein [Atlantibacter sp.]|uniref:GGDEF domain-containing protein n=1 Tax=Atlantibacter sp. TaxID=1903473 RepID=UPI002898A6C2|nr:GGDEF domain-containing protein [Atlantibacter sp.]
MTDTSHSFFRPERTLINACGIIVLTSLFYYFGASLRLINALSVFWPLNAVMAGVFARYAFLNRAHYYLLCYATMLVYDAMTTSWGMASLAINFSNMLFILIFATLMQRDRRRAAADDDEPLHVGKLFLYCLCAALACSLTGSVASIGIDNYKLWPLFADWFSEQFSTGVLVLPWILTLHLPRKKVELTAEQALPFIAVVASVGCSDLIGGAGSLAFPLAALIWCAMRYSLPVTCLVMLMTGVAEIVLVGNSAIQFNTAAPLETAQLFSARLGIAIMALCPLMVSTSVASINALMRQLSHRANYDYLTGALSRSGLLDTLNKPPYANTQFRTLAVMLIDIDYFKGINDTHGHDCGDAVLTAFGERLLRTVGAKGLVGRMGGEEFVVVCPNLTFSEGRGVAEQIRRRIAREAFCWGDTTLSVTVSIGMSHQACLQEGVLDSFTQLLPVADQHLYLSKKSGRDRVTASSVPDSETAKIITDSL